ncbi:programmed cell death protein 2-like [Dendronephthya gigantea]|uniref:programmed cell death protein 2-like n=1 Tax=Dendronephthya gigantea TaxID=151771 RepID=UPI00106A23C7|nr:programmed cell death protein 2-like [Dendronephthya gigantea]
MLGVPDEMVNPRDDLNSSWMTNKFGGFPNWMNEGPSVCPKCCLCEGQLPMVAQIYCPLENSSSHRVLYIFACVKMSCWNKRESWKVLRCMLFIKDDVNKVKETAHEAENEDTWCEDADDWGEEEVIEKEETITGHLESLTKNLDLNKTESLNNESSSVNKLQSTEAVVHERSNTFAQTAAQNSNRIRFIPYYITVLEEDLLVLEAGQLTPSEKRLLADYTAREGLPGVEEMMATTAADSQWGKEKYETSVAKHGDRIFQKFRKQISLCPEQCLRYSWDGEPLLMTSQGPGSIPSCNACGGKRVFELQLMPALVSLLRVETQDQGTNTRDNQDTDLYRNWSSECIEFGTVFVYTCSQGCWSEDERCREEYLLVHSDPDQHRFKSPK